MNFYKNGKNLYFCDNPRYIIAKHPCGGWGVYESTTTPGKFDLITTYPNLRDAKNDVARR